MENNFNDLIIISDYDMGYCFSVFYKGIIKYRGNITGEHKSIYEDYEDSIYDKDFTNMCNKYNCNILVCRDGNIEYYERGN